MMNFFMSLLIAPIAIAQYDSSAPSVAILEAQHKEQIEERTYQDHEVIDKEDKNNLGIDPYGYLSDELEVFEGPVMFSVDEDSDAVSSFQKANKQMAASVPDFFQLKDGDVMSGQNIQKWPFLEHFRTMALGLVATGQAPDVLLNEEPKRKFVQVTKGCALAVGEDCLVARSGAGDEFEKLYELRIDILLEVDEVVENDKKELWYKIKHEDDIPHPERIEGTWFVPATHVSVVELPEELCLDTDKKIVVDISEQILRAYKGDELVTEEPVSTGLSGRHATPIGEFSILKKLPSRYMQAPAPGIADWYDLPGVPYVMYFSDDGDALHGAYWHDKFGRRWSHGCVNLSYETARFLYGWTATGTKMYVQN